MFAYCLNCPVEYYDDGGFKAKIEGEPDDEEDKGFIPGDTADVGAKLQGAADKANSAVEGKGHVAGTHKHTYFASEVRSWGDSRIGVEVSYLGGEEVKYGKPGSIRFDIILYADDDHMIPIFAWDFKTGSATLPSTRIEKMLKELGDRIPIRVLR